MVGAVCQASRASRRRVLGLGQRPRVLVLHFLRYRRMHCAERVKYGCSKRQAGTHLVLCKALTQNTLPNKASHAPYSIRKSDLAATYRTNDYCPDGLPACCVPALRMRQTMSAWQLFTQGGSGIYSRQTICIKPIALGIW